MLNTRDATELYKILAPHLPEDKPDDALEFINQIVESIIENEQHSDFTDAIILIYEKTLEELSIMLPEQVLGLFVKGLEENKIVLLQDWMQKVGFNASD